MITWKRNVVRLKEILEDLSVKDSCRNEIGDESGFSLWREWARQVRSKGRCIYLIGNGASASMASHLAADVAKKGGIRTQVFTDLSFITAVANDICYEEVFAEPLRRWMEIGDMLVAISSSGNSENIVRAVNVARSLGGTVITLSAMCEDNSIRSLGNLNFYVAAHTYGIAETAHAAILHYWMDLIEMDFKDIS